MAKQSVNTDHLLSDDEAIRQRLEELIRTKSQAEIARKTETSHTNISRYLKGTKPPASFLSRLARSMNINPSWLLLGEGAPDVSVVTSDVSSMAGDVLELVNAMNSVAKMKLGELLGKDHLKVLRQLNDALGAYDSLREKLNLQTQGVMQELISKTDAALNSGAPQSAKSSIEAAKQLSRLCDSSELKAQLMDKEFWYEYQWGIPNRAFALQRDIFYQKLSSLRHPDEDFCRYAYQYMMALHAEHRIREALHVGSTAHGLTQGIPELKDWRKRLRVAKGMLYAEFGAIDKALPIVFRHSQGLSGEHLREIRPIVAVVQLHAGLTTIEALSHTKHTWNRAIALHCLRFARLSENKHVIEDAYERCVGDSKDRAQPNDFTAHITRLTLMALDGKVDEACAELESINQSDKRQRQRLRSPIYIAINHVIHASISRHAADSRPALDSTLKAEKMLNDLRGEHQPSIIIACYHASNVLHLIPTSSKNKEHRKVRQRAERFVRRSIKRGFRSLEHLKKLLPEQD